MHLSIFAAITAIVVSSPGDGLDLNLDGIVDGADIGIVLAGWGGDMPPGADANRDGILDGADLGILLAGWTTDHPSPEPSIEVWTNIAGVSPELHDAHDSAESMIVYQRHLDHEPWDGVFDGPYVMAKWVALKKPGGFDPVNYSGPLCLDWEAGLLDRLGDVDHPQFGAALAQAKAALDAARKMFPRAKVGLYGWPLRRYWGQDERWRTATREAARIIVPASGCLFPSTYELYPGEEAQDLQRYSEIVRLALEVADGKPVYLYTWQRFHPSSACAYELVPEAEWTALIGGLLGVEFEGDRVDGIVLWGADSTWQAEPWAVAERGDRSVVQWLSDLAARNLTMARSACHVGGAQ